MIDYNNLSQNIENYILNLKKENNFSSHLLKPKFLLRYAPGSMRKEEDGNRITPLTAFNMDRLDNINNFETGLSATVGFDYEINENSKKKRNI